MDQSSGTCANINAGTDKMSSLPQMGSCSVGQVDGVKIRAYKKDDCTDDPNGYVVGSNSCSGHLKYECNGEDITVNSYNSEGCIGNIVHSATFKGGDDICRDLSGGTSGPTPSGSAQCSMNSCPDSSHACYTDDSDPCYQQCQDHCTGNSPTPSNLTPSGGDEDHRPFMKTQCVKGQAANIGGMSVVIPSDGYCTNQGPSSSMMLTCDGKVNLVFLDLLHKYFLISLFPLSHSQVLH